MFSQLGTNDKEFKYLEFSCTTISDARILELAVPTPLNENSFLSFNHCNTSSFFCGTYIIHFVSQQYVLDLAPLRSCEQLRVGTHALLIFRILKLIYNNC